MTPVENTCPDCNGMGEIWEMQANPDQNEEARPCRRCSGSGVNPDGASKHVDQLADLGSDFGPVPSSDAENTGSTNKPSGEGAGTSNGPSGEPLNAAGTPSPAPVTEGSRDDAAL